MPAPKRRKSAQKERNNPEVHVECLLNWWLVFSSVLTLTFARVVPDPKTARAPDYSTRLRTSLRNTYTETLYPDARLFKAFSAEVHAFIAKRAKLKRHGDPETKEYNTKRFEDYVLKHFRTQRRKPIDDFKAQVATVVASTTWTSALKGPQENEDQHRIPFAIAMAWIAGAVYKTDPRELNVPLVTAMCDDSDYTDFSAFSS